MAHDDETRDGAGGRNLRGRDAYRSSEPGNRQGEHWDTQRHYDADRPQSPQDGRRVPQFGQGYDRQNDHRQNDHRQGGYGQGNDAGRYPGDQERGLIERAGDALTSWFGDEAAGARLQADSHRGKGPKGYVRSDDRIRDDVNDRLSDDHAVDASDIEVMVENGEVTLTGYVSSRQERRLAEDCVERVAGVRYVQNNLRIAPAGSRPGADKPEGHATLTAGTNR